MTEHLARAVTALDRGTGGLQMLMDLGNARFVADQPVAMGGLNLGPTPHEIAAAALAACTTQTLRLYAQRKGWILGETQVEVISKTDSASTPSETFERRISLDGSLDNDQKARLLEIADNCPIHRLLIRGASITTLLEDARFSHGTDLG